MATTTYPDSLRRVTNISAVDGSGHEHRKTVTTCPDHYNTDGIDWTDAREVEAWQVWIDRVHAADCRLAELRIERGGEAVDTARVESGVADAEWDDIPDKLEWAIATIEEA